MKIAAIGDLHCKRSSSGKIGPMLDGLAQKADILLLAGDLTNRGMILEMEVLLEELKDFPLPMIAVVGNHDHEQNHAESLQKMMENRGICVLDSSTCVVDGVGFIGTKGFCGGFAERRIQSFGEMAIKEFVQNSVNEALRMEKALEQLATEKKVGLLHYSPVKETLIGESPELFPFLGSSLCRCFRSSQGQCGFSRACASWLA